MFNYEYGLLMHMEIWNNINKKNNTRVCLISNLLNIKYKSLHKIKKRCIYLINIKN